MILEVVTDTPEVLVRRNPSPGRHKLSLLKNIYVERGTIEDWYALQELHYKGHSLAAGSRYYRCVYEDEGTPATLVGVIVFANPRPLDRDRMKVFPFTKPSQMGGRDTKLVNKMRMNWVNKTITWNNRTVLDTMYRGGGIAYRFKNLAYRMYCAEHRFGYVESRSSMGKFNPFSIKSGMRFTRPSSANALGPGSEFFQGYFESPLQDTVAILEEFYSFPEHHRKYVDRRLREFYHKHSSQEKSGDKRDLGMTRINTLSVEYIVKQLQQLILGSTVYWHWTNPDIKFDKLGMFVSQTELPKRLPLLAFDNQGPRDPMRMDLL